MLHCISDRCQVIIRVGRPVLLCHFGTKYGSVRELLPLRVLQRVHSDWEVYVRDDCCINIGYLGL